MHREVMEKPGTAKAHSVLDVTLESAAAWDKHVKQPESPTPPPQWARYIDSRLKQFCTR